MPVAHGLGQSVNEPRPCANDRIRCDAQFLRDGISRFEHDAGNVLGQRVGIGPHGLHRGLAISFVNAHGAVRADAVGVEEEHDFADHFLLGPGGADLLAASLADAGDFFETDGKLIDDGEDLFVEFLHQLLGVDRADALDQAAAEVFFDPFARGRRAAMNGTGLELKPVLAVLHPNTLRGDPLSGGNIRDVSHHGHKVALPFHGDSQNRIAVFLIVIGDALHHAGQPVLRRGRLIFISSHRRKSSRE